MRTIRGTLLSAATSRLLDPVWGHLTAGMFPILYFHRFQNEGPVNLGYPADELRVVLGELRRRRYHLVSLSDALDSVERGELMPRTVAFTVDDGYADFGQIAVPIFAEFDCPVTLFVATGFVDGRDWMWWDKVTHCLETARRWPAHLDLEGQIFALAPLQEFSPGLRDALVCVLKELPEEGKAAAIRHLAQELETVVPDLPPAGYEAMTWDDVRAATRRGVAIGAHSVTHPILARTSAEQAEREIRESCRRVAEMVPDCVPIFCYPNGQAEDQGQREERILRSLGCRAALTAVPTFVDRQAMWERPFQLGRFPAHRGMPEFLQVACGIEAIKERAWPSGASGSRR